jgi:hypothetical protein
VQIAAVAAGLSALFAEVPVAFTVLRLHRFVEAHGVRIGFDEQRRITGFCRGGDGMVS